MRFWSFLRLLYLGFVGRLDGRALLRALSEIIDESFILTVVASLFVGGIMVIQASSYVMQFGAQGMLGWGASYATLREISPLFIALVLNGRVGARNTAVLGAARLCGQDDMLRCLAIEPVACLALPRVLALTLSMPVLVLIGNASALGAASLLGYGMIGIHPSIFWTSVQSSLVVWDFLLGMIKAWVFGGAIGLISCYYGIRTSGSGRALGRSVNNSVVSSAIAVFFFNFLLSWWMG
ncbi:MAG: ABC transporter permease [Proteobacteria bacterium]|nr:ABC transporter permease [Pseudomonadota bacterium]